MGPLAAVERFLERLFERQSARLFRTGIRPVIVLRRLERAMEDGRTRDGARTLVPHRFVVRLHPADLATLRADHPDLAVTLADGALTFARHHGYTILDRPVVTIRPDPSLVAADVAVDVMTRDSSDVRDAAPGDQPDAPLAAEPPLAAEQTAVFVVPGVEGPRASLREVRPDQSSRTIAFDGGSLTIGRAPDNRVVLRDGRASRHHARIDARRGSLVLTDLGSTNGSFVNDRRVESIALGEGDRIRLGATVLVVEAIEATPDESAAAGRSHPAG